MKKIQLLLPVLVVSMFLTACSDEIVAPSIQVYTLKYIGNDQTNYESSLNEFDEGALVTVQPLGAMTKSGYTLISWNTEPDGSGAGYGPGLNFVMPSEDLVLYAQWIPEGYIGFITVSGGTYPGDDSGTGFDHEVTTFDIGEYEVTYELWYHVYRFAVTNGYQFQNPGTEGLSGVAGAYPVASLQPVTYINWRDAIIWINALNELKGLTPVYTNEGEPLRDSRDCNNKNENKQCDYSVYTHNSGSYSLQTEGQWQYAAAYDDGIGWSLFSENVIEPLSIKNMGDNTLEWCWDIYDGYPKVAQTDYTGASSGTSQRIRRGGVIGKRQPTNPYSIGVASELITFRIVNR